MGLIPKRMWKKWNNFFIHGGYQAKSLNSCKTACCFLCLQYLSSSWFEYLIPNTLLYLELKKKDTYRIHTLYKNFYYLSLKYGDILLIYTQQQVDNPFTAKISLGILVTFCNTNIMLVWRMWYWISYYP